MFDFLSKKPVQIAIVILLTALAYSNIFQNDFVSDDKGFVKRWAATQKISNIPQILAGKGPPFRQEATYRPVRDSLYVIYYRIFGENTFFWHLHGILVHAGVTVLVFLIVQQLVKLVVLIDSALRSSSRKTGLRAYKTDYTDSLHKWLPFIVSLLFGVHPIHTEAITFMTSSMDMIGPLFFFAAFYCYLRAREQGRLGKWGILGVFFALLAFFSYEMTLVLPLLLVLYEICFGKLRTKFSIFNFQFSINYIPYFALVLFYLGVRVFIVGRSPLENDYWVFRAVDYSRLLEPEIFLKYLTLLLLPVNLSYNHLIGPGFDTFVTYLNDLDIFSGYSFLNIKTFLGILAFFTLIFAVVWAFRRQHRLVSFAIAWYLISQLPYSNIWPQPTLMAERYLFIASFGFVLAVGYFIVLLPPRLRITIFAMVVATFIGITLVQNTYWKDKFVIWERVSRVYPKSGLAYYNLANTYIEDNDFKKSVIYMQKALEIHPTNYYYLFNLGNIYYEKFKDYKKAIAYYLEAIDKNPTYNLDVYLALAQAYADENMLKNAVSYLVMASNIKREQTNINDHNYDRLLSSVYKKLDEYSLRNPSLWSLYQGPLGISFNYPVSWEQKVSDGKVILTSRDDLYHLEVSFGEFRSGFEFAKYVDSQPEDMGDLVLVEPATFTGIPLSYVRVFDNGKIHKLQFFLFKKGRIIKILVYPSVSELRSIVDGLISTIKIQEEN